MMLSSPQDCCRPCESPVVVNTPGTPGTNGTPGANGATGANCFTLTTAQFLMPAEGGNVVVDVAQSVWAVVGQIVAVGIAGGASFGYFAVVSVPSITQITLQNLKNTAAGEYLTNSAVGTAFVAGNSVSPGGLQGPAGTVVGGTYFAIANNLSEGVAATKRTNLGLGSAAVLAAGIAAGNAAVVDAGGALTAGQAVFALAGGLESKTAVNARAALGLVIGTANTQIAPVNDGGGLTNGEMLRATATGIESVTNAVVQAQLGIGVLAVVTKAASYVATTTDGLILCDATAGNIIIDLPAAATSTGHVFIVKKIDATANTVTIRGHLAELIDGVNTQVISSQWTSVSLVSNGTASYII